jgi:hypothetical protein
MGFTMCLCFIRHPCSLLRKLWRARIECLLQDTGTYIRTLHLGVFGEYGEIWIDGGFYNALPLHAFEQGIDIPQEDAPAQQEHGDQFAYHHQFPRLLIWQPAESGHILDANV